MALKINDVEIEDTYAEAFKMWGTRVVITAKNRKWALEAATKMTGFATSVIGCRCEAGIEAEVDDAPDGRPGFFFTRFRYSNAADAMFAREEVARHELATASIALDGQIVQVRYSKLDGGRIQDVFDGRADTLGRVEEANPATVELIFPSPRVVSGVSATMGSLDVNLKAFLYADENGDPAIYSQDYTRLPPDPTIQLDFEPAQVVKLRLAIQALGKTGDVKIHIRDIVIR